MPGRPISTLNLSNEESRELKAFASTGNRREQLRANIILFRASGMTQQDTAKKLGCSVATVSKWTTHFRESGLKEFWQSVESENQQIKPPEQAKTLREIAKRCGVSVATVSRVINNLPNVSSDVTRRVRDELEAIGYRPDPELRKLMVHLRKNHSSRLRGGICSLETGGWHQGWDLYFSAVLSGAKAMAETLGFIWESYSMEKFFAHPQKALRLLYNRGINGIFIPPVQFDFSLGHSSLPLEADWGRFSVIVATNSFANTRFRRVVPNQFKNMLLICRSLRDLGYKKLGLILPHALDVIAMRHFSGAFAAFHMEIKHDMAPPFIYNDPQELISNEKFHEWYSREQPDALILNGELEAEIVNSELGIPPDEIGMAFWATLPHTPNTLGINELPETVGSLAIQQLSNMIIHQERGIPSHPTVLMVDGVWRTQEAQSSSYHR